LNTEEEERDRWSRALKTIYENENSLRHMNRLDKIHPNTRKTILNKPLYHGTDIKNLLSICEKGLLRGTAESVGYISAHDPLIGSDRIFDCIGNVSMSREQKDAIFFACGYGKNPKESKGQVIFEVDTRKLNIEDLYLRDCFGKKNCEAKYLSDIPKEAINRVFIRKFDWTNGLKVDEKYMTLDDACKS
jgi:hypothetical protein